ncbi:MAG: acyl-CoA dehydrogenase family protein [Pseudomonadota bacterium]
MKTIPPLLAATRKLATGIAAPNAADVDRHARFPSESLAAMREARLLSAGVPKELGGAGCSLRELAEICAALGQGCGSSGMVLAMHYIQVACIARHGLESEFFRDYLAELSREQTLLASMTSEVGTSGDTRSSVCAVEKADGMFTLNKDATTGSYCAQADAILVTARSSPESPASDQVLVLVRKQDYSLQQTSSWDTLGMRGTCSPGFKLHSHGPEQQIVPGLFADSSAQTMVPYSHVLWAALWSGIATDAFGLAANYVRSDARKKPGTVPHTATRLAETSVQLQAMRNNWLALAIEFDILGDSHEGRQALLSMGWALRLNNLKIAASVAAPQIVHQALQVVGILGYKNDSPFSVGRQYRDLLSPSLMVSNDRVTSKNASMLLVLKDD